jgi:hypothetical protein
MGLQATQVPDTEQERQQRVAELIADHGPDWSDQYKPGSFGCHELLDRAALAADFVERSVACHPACVQNPDWFALAEQAVAALQELYQRIGAEHLDDAAQPAAEP